MLVELQLLLGSVCAYTGGIRAQYSGQARRAIHKKRHQAKIYALTYIYGNTQNIMICNSFKNCNILYTLSVTANCIFPCLSFSKIMEQLSG